MAQAQRSTRDRILIAAAELIGEDPATSLSVRSVAARAGVSVGSLRFQFPTQRELHDAVLAGIVEHVAPDDGIHDASLPAHDRLAACLHRVVGLVGMGDEARRSWMRVVDAYMAAPPSEAARAGYVALVRQGERRIEHWLGVLAQEGALDPVGIPAAARFLSAVVDGLSLARGMPTETSALTTEAQTLALAAEAVLGPRRAAQAAPTTVDA